MKQFKDYLEQVQGITEETEGFRREREEWFDNWVDELIPYLVKKGKIKKASKKTMTQAAWDYVVKKGSNYEDLGEDITFSEK